MSMFLNGVTNSYVSRASAEAFGAFCSESDDTLLDQLRTRQALYVPPNGGFNNLLFEFYDHENPLRVFSVYFKPAETSYPVELLDTIEAHELVKARNKLALERLEKQTLSFTEVIHHEAIWDLIRTDKNQKFIAYPNAVKASDIVNHLNHLIYRVIAYPTYELVLTNAWLPFYFGIYDTGTPGNPECATVFFQRSYNTSTVDYSCFAVMDSDLESGISLNVVDWVLSHPSTVRETKDVVAALEEVRDHLVNEGPI